MKQRYMKTARQLDREEDEEDDEDDDDDALMVDSD